MPEISAADVKALRERTGLPMMECKKALETAGGDPDAAERHLREQGKKTQETRIGRDTSAGRIAVFNDPAKPVAAMIELQCESAPVANSPEFKQFANDLAKQLAQGPGASSPDELLELPSLAKPGQTLGDQKNDMFNRIREVFNLSRVVRIDAVCGAYAHHDGSMGGLVEVTGGNAEVAKDIAMHVVASKPQVVNKEELDPAAVTREREILMEAARKEGKPENILGKMVEGRLKDFYAAKVLAEQAFIKDPKKTIAQLAKESGAKIVRFIRWEMTRSGT